MKPLPLLAFAATLCTFAAPSASALEKEDIEKLLAAPHSREGIIDELKIFPDAREFKVVVQVTVEGEDPLPQTENITEAKIVDGKYFVVSFLIKEIDKTIHVALTFDKDAGVYRRWTLPEGDKVIESVGVSTKGSRAIAWRVMTEGEGGAKPLATLEQLSDDSIAWTELLQLEDGKLLRFDGTATVIKKD